MSAQEQYERYSQFLEVDPDNLQLLSDITNCAYELGRMQDVMEFSSRALQLDSSNGDIRATRALAALSLGNIEEALSLLQQLIQEGEQHPVIRYNFAYCLALRHEYQQALEQLTDAEDHLQDIPQMVHLKLKVLHFLGEVTQAIELGERALSLHPDDAMLHGLVSSLYIDETNFDQARSHAEQAIKTGNTIPEAHTTLGTLALSEQDDAVALDHFENAIRLKANSGRAWLGKAMAEMLQNSLESAEESFDTALQYMPNHLGTWQALAWCQLAKHDLDAAEATVRKALAIDDTFSENHGTLAVIAVLRGDTELAQQSIRRALGLDRESFSGLFAQALLLKQQGRAEASRKLIDGILDHPMMAGQPTLRSVLIKQMGKQKS